MNADIVALLGEGFIETVIMVIGSGVLGSIIGIPLGVLLHVTDKGGLMPKLATNAIVGVDLDYEAIGQNGSMLMVMCSGTAVVI